MFITRVIEDALRDLLAADTATLAPAALANHVHLIIAPFVPAEDTDFTTLTPATFTGSAAKSATVGAQAAFFDPLTLSNVIQLGEPVGGWTWVCTVAPGVAETVYGYAVTDNADAVTFGSGLFDTPVVITNVGDSVAIGYIRINFPLPMSDE